MKRVLCVWLPHWPLQRLCSVRPELKERPLVLYGPASRNGWQVRYASRAALAEGVVPGIPLAEAQALLSRQMPSSARRADPHYAQHDPQADRQFLESLAVWCQRYAPLVGLEGIADWGLRIADCARIQSAIRNPKSAITPSTPPLRKGGAGGVKELRMLFPFNPQ